LMSARIASQEPQLFELSTQLRVEFRKGSGDAETSRARLSADATAIGQNQYIELVGGLGRQQRLADHGARRFRLKMLLERRVVDCDVPLAGPQKNAAHRGLAPAYRQILNDRCCHEILYLSCNYRASAFGCCAACGCLSPA